MLQILHIENIAVIEQAEISFDRGFNVLTGETGAGKSIVIDAISAILGERTSRDLIRTGAPNAFVSAIFTDVPPSAWFERNRVEYAPEELSIQREILADGRNPCRVNGRPVTVSQLRALGAELVNIHTIKPLDMETIKKETLKCNGRVLVCEEANMYGGLGEAVSYGLVGTDGIKFDHVAVMDRFGQSGLSGELLEEYGITAENIMNHARELSKR